MPFTIVLFAWRKPNTSPAEFKHHYETTHLPLLKSIAGERFPLTHTRHYIQRTSGDNADSDMSNDTHPAVTFAGEPKDFDYDVFAELVFEDESKFQAFFAAVSEPDAAKKIQADEETFLDRAKMVVAAVDRVEATTR